mgnify:CR=1 FL=1
MARKATTKRRTTRTTKKNEDISTPTINAAVLDDAQKTKLSLDSKPKVNFMIPLVPGEPAGSFETVCINGYLMKLQKGKMLQVPKPVADILANKYRVEMEAGSNVLVDRSAETKKALE